MIFIFTGQPNKLYFTIVTFTPSRTSLLRQHALERLICVLGHLLILATIFSVLVLVFLSIKQLVNQMDWTSDIIIFRYVEYIFVTQPLHLANIFLASHS